MGLVRALAHLVARFFDVLFSRPLSPGEQADVAKWLEDTERSMFWAQPVVDQRHGFGAARHVHDSTDGRRDLVRAALLHDVGKRHSRLGVAGRSWASIVRLLGTGGGPRIRSYLDHGPAAGRELAAAGAENVVVAYATHHHAERPPEVSAQDWAILDRADRVRR